MSTIPNCPECNSEYAYENGTLFACPDCGHEWSAEEAAAAAEALILRDAHGNELNS
ncbi:MAG: alkylphosphonate utilization protein, partial [Akkermansiaceae bacterium]